MTTSVSLQLVREEERFIGDAEGFLGDEVAEVSGSRASSRREASTVQRRTSRAWRPKLATLATVSLALDEVAIVLVVLAVVVAFVAGDDIEDGV